MAQSKVWHILNKSTAATTPTVLTWWAGVRNIIVYDAAASSMGNDGIASAMLAEGSPVNDASVIAKGTRLAARTGLVQLDGT